MAQIHSKDTAPEWTVKRLLYRLGYRYRLNVKTHPGHPDIVFPSRKKVIFVHGCFWHGHPCKRGFHMPKTNQAYWEGKILRNMQRDVKNTADLTERGWQVLQAWECETRGDGLADALRRFLDAP